MYHDTTQPSTLYSPVRIFLLHQQRSIWDEEKQLQGRYRVFNIDELQCAAAASVESKCCVSMTKLAKGGLSKVFRLIMDDGKTVPACIPISNSEPFIPPLPK